MILLLLSVHIQWLPYMDYVLIKNGILAVEGDYRAADILICDNKIVDIGSQLTRPDLETPVIDAGGKYILPGGIDINRSFYHHFCYDQQRFLRLLKSQIISGTTFWLDALPIHELSTTPNSVQMESIAMPDYSFHCLVDAVFCQNPESFLPLILTHGISSLVFNWPLQESIPDARLEKVFEFAKENDLLIIFDLQFLHQYDNVDNDSASETAMDYHLRELKQLSAIVEKHRFRACFLNVHFVEELDILKKLHQECDIYAELELSVTLGGKGAFKSNVDIPIVRNVSFQPLDAHQLIKEVLENEWCLIGRADMSVFNEESLLNGVAYNRPDDYFNSKYFLSVLSSIPIDGTFLSPQQIVNIIAERPSRLFNIFPVKGNLKAGGDADLIIWDAGYERNLFVSFSRLGTVNQEFKLRGRTEFIFLHGKIVYNGEQILNEPHAGQYLCRLN